MRYSKIARDAKQSEPLLISVREAAHRLGLGVWVVRDLCVSGELRAGKPTREWRIDPASVEEYAKRITTRDGEVQAS
ncbi:helix-turn-helix domain-containing protein [Nocardioides sp. NPDC101246]|uniref:helix-turn-helix domain-containing protein n=1 Tax=Nocardioides sp. NPDC101246 TaxID=3364336 RepID=UPI00380E6964